ncbi:ribonuclease 3 [Alicyclobacillus cellulosilyticus]|uniref:Ribonuclease 3 n=1 Tax=Alicyclobacillus cellulosilyticus TaxID=1003997 RepID=A0A917KD58_9BACL|nr:ribonuclease III [Alicyclobacillus cellulosilyticus]GGJ07979.1 ribonuclease 3 [Alicyclobacillus cellulosilyticus]
MVSKWDELQAALGTRFNRVELLIQAFTHASYRNEHRKSPIEDNERLEFLGDAVLELVVSEYLFHLRPDWPEGELTRLRAAIVCEPSLERFARNLGFHHYVRLGRGEERSGGRQRPALLADVFEAFIGALYLDQGLDAVRAFAERHMFAHLDPSSVTPDYKTELQEWVQQHTAADLHYEIVEERGPAHAREFVARVIVGVEELGTGVGRSKKEAEQHAAGEALQKLKGRTLGGS